MLTDFMRLRWQIFQHEVEHLYNIYFLRHDVTERKLKWYKLTPIDVKAMKEERRRRKLRARDEL